MKASPKTTCGRGLHKFQCRHCSKLLYFVDFKASATLAAIGLNNNLGAANGQTHRMPELTYAQP